MYCLKVTSPAGSLMAEWPEVNAFVELYRLKRIPPLSELYDVKRDEEITA